MDDSTETEFTLRLPADLHTQLVQLAQAEHRSLQSMLIIILRQAIDKQNNVARQDVMDQWDDRNHPES